MARKLERLGHKTHEVNKYPGSVFTPLPPDLIDRPQWTAPDVIRAVRSPRDLAQTGADSIVQISSTHTVVVTDLLAGYTDATVYDILVYPGLTFTVDSATPDPADPQRTLIHLAETHPNDALPVTTQAPTLPVPANAPGGVGDLWSVPIQEPRPGYGVRIRQDVYHFPSQDTIEDINAARALPTVPGMMIPIFDRDPAVDLVRLRGEDVPFPEFARRVALLPRQADQTILLFGCASAVSLEDGPNLAEEVRDATHQDVIATAQIIWEMPNNAGVRLAPFTEEIMMGHELLPPTDEQWANPPHDVQWLLYPKEGGPPIPLSPDLAKAINQINPDAPTHQLSALPITVPVPWLAPTTAT